MTSMPVSAIRRFLLAAAVVSVILSAGCGGGKPSPTPNVVLVVVDTLRADHLSHYGYELPTAVALDGFAAGATRFTDCTAPSPWTNPSVASLFSGMETARHGSNEFGSALSTEIQTLAEVMQAAGWHTAAISFNPGIRSELDYDQGFVDYDEHLGKASRSPDISEMVDRVVTWLDGRPEKPFFLYLQPMNVHGPYRVPEAHRTALLGREPVPGFRYYGDAMHAIMRKGELEVRDHLGSDYLRSLTEQYDTAIRYTTDQLADLFQILHDRGLFDDSLVIVTADHGEELFDHGGFSHGYSLHREVLQVPLYVKLPRQGEARVVDAPCSLIDLLPTILGILGVTDGVPRDGSSLVPVLTGSPAVERAGARPQIYQTAWKNRCVGRAIRTDRFKLIEIDRNYEGLRNVVELYELAEDPNEQADLASERPAAVRRLRRQLHRHFSAVAGRGVTAPENRLEELDLERLRALGYVADEDHTTLDVAPNP